MKTGIIFDIQRFCLKDGPGIRTTVFFKGCPLNCLWCHNPESQSFQKEIFYDAERCIMCQRCRTVCPMACHEFGEKGHVYSRDACNLCGSCTAYCPVKVLRTVGYEMTVEEILEEVGKDEVFYRNSGGGMTLSGGEPMAQFDFVLALAKAAKEGGLHICMETSGYGEMGRFEKISEYVDIFLYDYKITDSDEHRRYTGASNELILKNLKRLDGLGAQIILRCPIIPGMNDKGEHFRGIATLANGLKNVQRIELEPYHPLGSGKARMLGKEYSLQGLSFSDKALINEWVNWIQKEVGITVLEA